MADHLCAASWAKVRNETDEIRQRLTASGREYGTPRLSQPWYPGFGDSFVVVASTLSVIMLLTLRAVTPGPDPDQRRLDQRARPRLYRYLAHPNQSALSFLQASRADGSR
jgi:hypothetical protein